VVDRTACHSSRIESFGIVDCVWQSPLLFKRASWRFRALIESLKVLEKFRISERKVQIIVMMGS
jgi:hypothetical protein